MSALWHNLLNFWDSLPFAWQLVIRSVAGIIAISAGFCEK